MPMTPLERKAAFVSAVVLNQTTQEKAAKEDLGVSAFHLTESIAERRASSDEFKQRFADYIGRPFEEVWGERTTSAAQVA